MADSSEPVPTKKWVIITQVHLRDEAKYGMSYDYEANSTDCTKIEMAIKSMGFKTL